MSYGTRPLAPQLRNPTVSGPPNSTGQSPALVARINEKKVELENLKQLRDLSAGLAGQMQMLEERLATLADGTEAVAAVLSNWHNVLRAINMASAKIPKPQDPHDRHDEEEAKKGSDVPLPQTLVRIPTQQQPPQTQPSSEG